MARGPFNGWTSPQSATVPPVAPHSDCKPAGGPRRAICQIYGSHLFLATAAESGGSSGRSTVSLPNKLSTAGRSMEEAVNMDSHRDAFMHTNIYTYTLSGRLLLHKCHNNTLVIHAVSLS